MAMSAGLAAAQLFPAGTLVLSQQQLQSMALQVMQAPANAQVRAEPARGRMVQPRPDMGWSLGGGGPECCAPKAQTMLTNGFAAGLDAPQTAQQLQQAQVQLQQAQAMQSQSSTPSDQLQQLHQAHAQLQHAQQLFVQQVGGTKSVGARDV